ncbi:MAG: DUF4097 family beta strand repeat-containing protein [Planctomycetota bacterium]
MSRAVPLAVAAVSAGPVLLGLGGCYETTPRAEETRTFQLRHAGALNVEARTGFGDVDIATTGTPLPRWAEQTEDAPSRGSAAADEVYVVAVVGSRDAERLALASVEPRIENGTLYLRESWPATTRKNLNEGTRWAVRMPGVRAADVYTDFGDIALHHATGPASLESDFGDVLLHEHRGSVVVDTDYGDVAITLADGHSGPFEVVSGYGDIAVDGVRVPANIRTDFGDIAVHGASAPLDLHTDYGEISASFTQDAAGPIRAYSDFGQVRVELGTAFSGVLEAATDFGSVKVRGDVPEHASIRGKKDYRLLTLAPRTGAGSEVARESALESDYGDVIIEFRGEANRID